MHRDGYALVAGSAITSVLGMLFWVVAARRFSPADVGIASAMIAAMSFLANVATLGLRNGFIRFLPGSADPGRLIQRGYAVSIVAASLAALVFLAGQPVWAPELSLLRSSVGASALFVFGAIFWLLFVLQDAVLTGLREARWVPLENAAFAVGKLLLLLVLISASPWSIYLAWVVPAMLVLIPVNLLVARTVGRRRGTANGATSLRPVVRFAAADHVAALLWLATTELVPLAVLATAGPTDSATYFLSFLIAYTLYLVVSNVGAALVVEAALNPHRETLVLRRAMRQSALLVVPAALVATVVAPWILSLLGQHYYETGATLLRLMLLSAIPYVVVGVAVGRARVRQELGTVIAIYAALAGAIFLAALLGVERHGIVVLGWAWLGVQTALALVLAPSVLGFGRTPGATLLAAASRLSSAARKLRRSRISAELVASALEATGFPPTAAAKIIPSTNDVIVAEASTSAQDLIVKVATSPAGNSAIEGSVVALRRLADDPRARLWRHRPELLAHGHLGERMFSVETRLPGVVVTRLPRRRRAAALERGAAAIRSLHEVTQVSRMVDDAWLHAVVDEPIARLTEAIGPRNREAQLDALRAELWNALADRTLLVSWVHGDLWAGNMVALEPETPDEDLVVGFVDWEDSGADGLVEVDLAHLWLSEDPGEIGPVVRRILGAPCDWDALHLVHGPLVLEPSVVSVRAGVLLAWLKHVTACIRRSTDFEPSQRWMRNNVLSVLDAVANSSAAVPSTSQK